MKYTELSEKLGKFEEHENTVVQFLLVLFVKFIFGTTSNVTVKTK